jgi:single-stranded-DNA-specific exonuclease
MNHQEFNSINQKNWQVKKFDQRLSKMIGQHFELSSIIADLLAIREIDLDQVIDFLDPKIKNILPDPNDLGSMELAVNHVIKAIEKKQKITIFADYDVDGATSSAIMMRFFRELDINAEVYIPDRILEGYGPNTQALLKLKAQGTDLVITLDCGTVAFKPLEEAKKAGLEVIVIDHHLGVIEKPEAIAVINPNLLDEKFIHKNICAATVCFLFVVALNRKLREIGFYQNKVEPKIFELLDLVALGTVCDVMPLTGINRALVSAGLKILKQRKNIGIRTICDLASLDNQPDSYSLGFIIGPRINAGGRVGQANLGSKILTTNCEIEASDIAKKLEFYNQQRKDLESDTLQQAIEDLENSNQGFSKNDPVIFAINHNWHQGVIGIVASRLKDLYNKPVAVIAIDQAINKGKASCRSISGIDFGAEILNARINQLLIEGGGHAMAGGFSVAIDKIKELHQFFCQKFAVRLQQISQDNRVYYDLELDIMQINLDLIKQLQKLEPFGVGNNRPKFLIKDAVKIRSQIIGQKQDHISAIFSGKSVIGYNNSFNAIAFKSVGSKLGDLLLGTKNNQALNLIATLNINSWMGIDKVQIQIEDVII